MAWFLFLDESGHDREASPYEVLAGVAITYKQGPGLEAQEENVAREVQGTRARGGRGRERRGFCQEATANHQPLRRAKETPQRRHLKVVEKYERYSKAAAWVVIVLFAGEMLLKHVWSYPVPGWADFVLFVVMIAMTVFGLLADYGGKNRG